MDQINPEFVNLIVRIQLKFCSSALIERTFNSSFNHDNYFMVLEMVRAKVVVIRVAMLFGLYLFSTSHLA